MRGAKGDKGDKGDPGSKGDPGNNGVTPTFAIGTVNTGNATDGAEVTISQGSDTTYELNFLIPRGIDGDGSEDLSDFIDRLNSTNTRVSTLEIESSDYETRITALEEGGGGGSGGSWGGGIIASYDSDTETVEFIYAAVGMSVEYSSDDEMIIFM